jgi:SAM-dependent methyltransferase
LRQYALLVLPAANRVYAESAADLGVAEAEITLGVDASVQTIAGVRYIEFAADDLDFAAVARLSVAYALFTREDDALRPVALPAVNQYDDDLVTIQRYTGKTNEYFTKLLVNLTLPAGATTLLDPMAGRGTTLNQAVIYGLDAIGVEIDKKDCEAYRTFFSTWLKNKRLPHKARNEKARFSVDFAPDRPTLDGGGGQKAVMINGDSREVDTLLKKHSVDAIVTDLPYNIRHREKQPIQLVAESLPAWQKVLRPGGRIGVAFNTKVSPRQDLIRCFEAAGCDVLDDTRFEHRVDQSITRDLLVATVRGA